MWRKAWFHWVVLAVVVMVFYVWEPWREDRAGVDGGVSAAALVDQAEAERQKVIPDALACPCGMDTWCSGPRGGSYCVDVEGRKKYKPKG